MSKESPKPHIPFPATAEKYRQVILDRCWRHVQKAVSEQMPALRERLFEPLPFVHRIMQKSQDE